MDSGAISGGRVFGQREKNSKSDEERRSEGMRLCGIDEEEWRTVLLFLGQGVAGEEIEREIFAAAGARSGESRCEGGGKTGATDRGVKLAAVAKLRDGHGGHARGGRKRGRRTADVWVPVGSDTKRGRFGPGAGCGPEGKGTGQRKRDFGQR